MLLLHSRESLTCHAYPSSVIRNLYRSVSHVKKSSRLSSRRRSRNSNFYHYVRNGEGKGKNAFDRKESIVIVINRIIIGKGKRSKLNLRSSTRDNYCPLRIAVRTRHLVKKCCEYHGYYFTAKTHEGTDEYRS